MQLLQFASRTDFRAAAQELRAGARAAAGDSSPQARSEGAASSGEPSSGSAKTEPSARRRDVIGIDTATCSYCGAKFPLIAEAIDAHSKECTREHSPSKPSKLPAGSFPRSCSFDDGLAGVNAEPTGTLQHARLRRGRAASVGDSADVSDFAAGRKLDSKRPQAGGHLPAGVGDLADISDFFAGTKAENHAGSRQRAKSVGDLGDIGALTAGAKAVPNNSLRQVRSQAPVSSDDLPDIGEFLAGTKAAPKRALQPVSLQRHSAVATTVAAEDVIGKDTATCAYCGLRFPLDAEAIDAHSKQCSLTMKAPANARSRLSKLTGSAARRARSWSIS